MKDESTDDLKNAELVFEDFSKEYGEKYNLLNANHIGIGANASVFKTTELARNLPVAIKVHINGITPENASRGWTISTVAKNPQIASTYTIEYFKDRQDRQCQAVVTQFVPGQTLENLLDEYDKLKDEEKSIIVEDFAYSFVPSLLDVLNFCHNLGYGHGDLHERNVMTHLKGIEVRFELNAILIDFDNASIETEVYQPDEKSKIEADERLVKRMLRNILYSWEHMPSVEILLNNYKQVRPLTVAYKKLLEFIKISRLPVFTEASIRIFLKTLLGISLERHQIKQLLDSLALVADYKNRTFEFRGALQDFNMEYQLWEETEDLRTEMTYILDAEFKNNFYRRIFKD